MNDLSTYLKARGFMRTGDLLEWRSKSLIGWSIRTFTGENVNHSSLIVRLTEYEGVERKRYVVEALEHGTVLNLLSRRLETFNGNVWWYPLCESWNCKRGEIGERALTYIGVKYDYKAIVKQLVSRVYVNPETLFCSEYVWAAYGQTGVAPWPGELTRKLLIFKKPVRLL